MVDVEAAGRDVGRHHDLDLTGTEAVHDRVALRLVHAAVDAVGDEAVRLELLGQPRGGPLRPDEDEHRLVVLHTEQAFERLVLLVARDAEAVLVGLRDGLRRVVDADVRRVAQVALRHAPDGLGHRGGEQRDLPLVGRVLQDPLDVLEKAHVEHLVRFVEAEEVHAGEVERAAPQVVGDAPRRADDHVHGALQRVALDVDGLPAVDGQHVHAALAHMLAVGPHGLRDLHCQLARRREDDGLHVRAREVEALQERQGERGRLPGAGLRLTDQVAAREQRRDGAGLDGGGGLVAELLHRREDLGRQAEIGERDVGGVAHGGARLQRKGAPMPLGLRVAVRGWRPGARFRYDGRCMRSV